MITNSECAFCGGATSARHEMDEMAIGKRLVTIVREFTQCTECGETYVTEEQSERNRRRASEEIRKKEDLLLPDEIRGIREKYDLSQEQLEGLIGAGPKTVTRWETGKVFQNQATDSLLRVIDRFPRVLAFLAERHGIEFHLPGYYAPPSAGDRPSYTYERTEASGMGMGTVLVFTAESVVPDSQEASEKGTYSSKRQEPWKQNWTVKAVG